MLYTMSATYLTYKQCCDGLLRRDIPKPIDCEVISWYGQDNTGAYARAMT
jgi:hypothetical protein